MKDSLDKVFENAGVSDNQMTSQTYKTIKQIVAEHPEILISRVCGNLDSAIERAVSLTDELGARTSDALMRYISDTDLKNAVACFNSTLTITQEVFGEENMTEAVICKAIEAGSYIAYRAIMGEAQQPSRRY